MLTQNRFYLYDIQLPLETNLVKLIPNVRQILTFFIFIRKREWGVCTSLLLSQWIVAENDPHIITMKYRQIDRRYVSELKP